MHSADYNSITNSKVQTSDHMLFSESATSLKKMLVSKSMTAYQTLNDSKKLNFVVSCFRCFMTHFELEQENGLNLRFV